MYKIYSNRIVLPEEVAKGYLVIDGDRIKDIVLDEIPEGEYVDLTNKYILPGIINLTTREYADEINSQDNKFFSEKKVFHLIDKAAAEYGITTNFNLFGIDCLLENQSIEDAIDQLKKIKARDLCTSLVDHKTHILFRLGDQLSNKNLRELIINDVVDFITCTGYFSKGTFNYQNQYLVQNIQNTYELTDGEANQILEKLITIREAIALDELSFRIKSAKSKHIPFASNRYTLVEKLYEKYKIKINIIAGVHTDETIHKMRDKDVYYHIDIVSVANSEDFLHLLEHFKKRDVYLAMSSSKPKDILSYIFELEGTIGLFDAVKLFTKYPAKVAELEDRGEIAVGKRADLIVVDIIDQLPMNVCTIKNGKTIVEYHYR